MSGGVPAGWVLVPVEPTAEMTEAGEDMVTYPADDFIRNRADSVWSAMLAATPTPPIEGRDADVERVEKVARAIDPDVWKAFDSDRARYPADPKERFYAYPRVAASLDKARAALQALGERG